MTKGNQPKRSTASTADWYASASNPNDPANAPGYYDDPEAYWVGQGTHMTPFAISSPAHERQESAIASLLADKRFNPPDPSGSQALPPASIFEAGCGGGRLANFFARLPLTKAASYSAIDLGPDQIESTRKWRPDALRLEVADLRLYRPEADAAGNPDPKYDLVVSSEVLMHIPPGAHLTAAIENLINLTRPNGRLLLIEWVPDETKAAYFARHPEKIAAHNWPHNYLQLLTPLPVDLLHSTRSDQQMLYYLAVR